MLLNIIRDRRLRRKLLYTLFVVLAVMAVAQIPVYGINGTYMSLLFSKTSLTGFMNSLSGGAMGKMSMGGFGIASYITASIVIQLMTVIFPSLETLRRDGERGKRLFERAEFILSMTFALIGGIILSVAYGRNGLFTSFTLPTVVIAVIQWEAGAYIIIRLALSVEKHGIGNGPTLILGFNILSEMPSSVYSFVQSNILNSKGHIRYDALGITALCVIAVFLLAVYLQTGMDNIPLKVSGKKASAISADGRLPVSVNIANVLPVVYASALIGMPYAVITLSGAKQKGFIRTLTDITNSANWFSPTKWTHFTGLALYLLFIIAFAWYSADLAFSPEEIADTMKKNGDVIPDVTPGFSTVKYLRKRKNVMTAVNIIFLLLITVVPNIIAYRLKVYSFPFAGTSLIIVINMIYDEHLRIHAACIHDSRKLALFPKEKSAGRFRRKGKKAAAKSLDRIRKSVRRSGGAL